MRITYNGIAFRLMTKDVRLVSVFINFNMKNASRIQKASDGVNRNLSAIVEPIRTKIFELTDHPIR